MSESNREKTTQFVRLFAGCEHDIYRYIYTLLPDEDQAQDVFQETAVALWEKFDEYREGEPFRAWACGFAWNKVLAHRRKFARHPIAFNSQVMELLSDQYREERVVLESQTRALSECMAKLAAADRQLIETRYGGKMTIAQLAEQTQRPANTLYKSLERIRRQLLACVQGALGMEGGA